MNEFGVAWFLNPNEPSVGFFSRPGQPAKSIENIHELPNNIIWVTNISFKAMRDKGLYSLPHIRESNYFRVQLEQIAGDLGLLDRDPAEIAESLADLLESAISALEATLDQKRAFVDYRYSNHLQQSTLPPALAQTPTLPEYDPTFSEYIFNNATQITQAFTGVRAPKGSKATRLRVPLYQHYKYILANEIFPSVGSWLSKDLPSNVKHNMHSDGIADWWLKLAESQCALAKVIIHKINPSVARYATPGVLGSPNAPTRNWFALPDLIAISEYCDFEVEELLVIKKDSSSQVRLIDACEALSRECGSNGYVAGLAMHMVFGSLMTGLNRAPTTIGAYLSAMDRASLLKLAAAVNNTNHVVGSFSSGALTVFCSNPSFNISDLSSLYGYGYDLGLIPQFHHLKEIVNCDFFNRDVDVSFLPFKSHDDMYIQFIKDSPEYTAVQSLISDPNISLSTIRNNAI